MSKETSGRNFHQRDFFESIGRFYKPFWQKKLENGAAEIENCAGEFLKNFENDPGQKF